MRHVLLKKNGVLTYRNHDYLPTLNISKSRKWKVMYVGICKTDRNIVDSPSKNDVILGHEVVVMSPIKQKGKYYSLNNEISCGKCTYCIEGLTSHCQSLIELGVNADGGYAEIIFAPKKNLYELSFKKIELGVLVEPLACAIHGCERIIHAIKHLNKKKIIPNVLILGAGVSGKLIAYILKKQKISGSYYIFDIQPTAMLWCNDLNVTPITSLKNNYYHLVIECSGSIDGLSTAYNIVRRAGIICIYGLPEREKVAFDARKIFERELTVMSSVAGCDDKTMMTAISYISHDESFFDSLIGKKISLEQVPREILNEKPKAGTRTLVQIAGV